jgi:hypothetical protein
MVLMFGGNGRRMYTVAAMEEVVLRGDGVWWWGWICNSTNNQKRYKEGNSRYSFKWRAYENKL